MTLVGRTVIGGQQQCPCILLNNNYNVFCRVLLWLLCFYIIIMFVVFCAILIDLSISNNNNYI